MRGMFLYIYLYVCIFHDSSVKVSPYLLVSMTPGVYSPPYCRQASSLIFSWHYCTACILLVTMAHTYPICFFLTTQVFCMGLCCLLGFHSLCTASVICNRWVLIVHKSPEMGGFPAAWSYHCLRYFHVLVLVTPRRLVTHYMATGFVLPWLHAI